METINNRLTDLIDRICIEKDNFIQEKGRAPTYIVMSWAVAQRIKDMTIKLFKEEKSDEIYGMKILGDIDNTSLDFRLLDIRELR